MHTPTTPSMPHTTFARRPAMRGGLAGAAALLLGSASALGAGALLLSDHPAAHIAGSLAIVLAAVALLGALRTGD